MSKISTANTPRNLNINSGSAWARGPPTASPSSANNPSSQPIIGTAPVAPPQAQQGPATASRVNGQATHSRRPSAAIPSSSGTAGGNGPYQASPTTLKEPVGVSKSVVAPIPAKASVQFGSIDDSNAVLSTSPAAPSAVTELKQIKTFGSISAGSNEPTPASPVVAKASTPTRTDSPAPSGKPKKKLDVNSLFQKTQSAPAQAQAPAATPSAAPTPAPQQQQQQQQQQPATSGPAQPSQDAPPRPLPKQQGSFDSPSMRSGPLPLSHPPNQTPPMQPGNGPASYHFTPPHLRPAGNGAPGANPPRSPSFNRTMTNGNMRGPPGAPGSGGLGSPRMGHPSITPGPAPSTPSQPPLPGMPPNMMNVPGGPVNHPPHMTGPVPSQGQMPPHMAPQMWGYYYPTGYDPNMPPYYWSPHPGHMPPHMAPPPHGPQQTPLMQPSSLPTPNQPTMPMPISPRVPSAVAHTTPSTPASPHPGLAQAPAGTRTSFIATKRPILIKNSAGEMVDIADLSKKVPPKQEDGPAAVKGEETPRRPVSIRLETVDAHKKRLEEEKLKGVDKKKEEEMAKRKAQRDAEAKERAKRDQEEKERRQREQEDAKKQEIDEKEREERTKREAEEAEKERIRLEEVAKVQEQERLKKLDEEEKERVRLEAEAKEKARLAEIEAKKKEEEEAKRKAEEEAKRKEEEELKRKEEEARKAEEAKKAAEAARLEAEAKQKAEEEAKRQKEKEEQEAAAAAATQAAAQANQAANDSASQASTPLNGTSAYASPARSVTALPKNTAPPARRPIPGRLDLSSTTSANLPQPLPSALASARIIEDIGKVSYPEGIKAPSSELNMNAQSGRFRYDRDFLMQFMKVCKEKPDDMPSLDAIGLEPSEQQGGFAGRRGRPSMPAAAAARGAMGQLGLSGPAGAPFGGKSFGGGGMGQFQTPRSSEERFAASSAPRSAVSGAVPFPRQTLGRTNSTTGPPLQGIPGRRETPQRTHSGRGTKRTDSKVGPPPSGMQNLIAAEPDLHHAENSWSTQRKPTGQDPNSPEFIDRKVKGLLNKLTMEKFDSIAAQILEWANRSVQEVDGRTLIQVIRLVFEKATDEAAWSEMYARLCRFLMERISQDVRDEGIKNADGKPIAGGNLFRKYLLNRCQEDFERGWSAKESAMLAAASKAEDDKAVAAAAEKAGGGEEVLYSDEYYASQKAKRRGLGLVKFIGELFKLQMLTERIMHECIKKLLSNVENPEEEEIESLCKLLATVGQALDTPKARNHMDIYFARMQELSNSSQISSRIQYMLLDIIELRGRKWVSRTQVAAPTTIAEVHQKAERDRQVAEREAALRQAGGRDQTRGGRRDTRDYAGPPQVGADGWTTPAARPPSKAGDLSNFGKISKSTTMQFGPSSVFSKKERRESSSVTRVSSSSNMFAALNSSEATPDAVSVGSRTANSTRPPSRKGSIDFSVSSMADMTPQRKRLLLQPRTQTFASDAGSVKDDGGSAVGPSEIGDEDAASTAASTSGAHAPQGMTLDQAKRKVKEDVKELFMLRQLSEAEAYFAALPSDFRWLLVEELVHRAVDGRPSDVQLITDVFDLVASKALVTEEQFSRGFAKDMEYLEDTSTDSPSAYGNVAALLKAAKLSQEAIEKLADEIVVEGEMAVTPKEKLLKKYTALTT